MRIYNGNYTIDVIENIENNYITFNLYKESQFDDHYYHVAVSIGKERIEELSNTEFISIMHSRLRDLDSWK